MPASAVFVSPPKDPLPLIKEIFPNHSRIEEKQNDPPVWKIYQQETLLGYAFETVDVVSIPAYSGEPVNMLVTLDPEGTFLGAKVLEHHEPILLIGIPEQKLTDFADQYTGLSISDRIKVGGQPSDGYVNLDAISGATVTVMVVNVAITRAATKVARKLGIIAEYEQVSLPPAAIKQDFYEPASWQKLTGDGSIRRLYLDRETVDKAFVGTDAENIDLATEAEKQDRFADIYYTQLNIPTIGRTLLGDFSYERLIEQLQPGEHAIAIMGNGYSFKGSGYVRGGIFDRIQVHQNDLAISFRDLDQERINDIFAAGAPRFKEMSLFILREHIEFDPGSPWQFELLVRRQTGAIDSVFTSFKGSYEPIEHYLDRPVVIIEPEEEPQPLWMLVWQEKRVESTLLIISLVVLLAILFFQDPLVKRPKLLQTIRHVYLAYTVLFIGWYCAGQISIVNVFTFLQSLFSDFNWGLFLLDPIIFIVWVAVAVTLLLWGRGVFCGWLCPFGALQELINELGRKLKIPQLEVPFSIHERLWAVKYLILLALFGMSLESLALAEQFAEVEPFKTTFLLNFNREWYFVFYALFLLVINLFSRKLFCRYVCPLGAALSVPSGIRLFDWLKRRPECGKPCQICAKECEIQAIEPNGVINMRECHHCLDCQMTYFNESKCPPLKKVAYKKRKQMEQQIATITVED
ncbi:transcriptional regulator NosR [Vibrio sp. HN007]|uniref:transcriptional regulator NosR n=1 Tax=Vibrio iocasae TaxID=3098914 RepID=UPI0035D46CE9